MSPVGSVSRIGPFLFFGEKAMRARPKAVAFDVDVTRLVSLQEALPGWQIEVVHGVSASSIAGTWNPGAADLLVVGVPGNGTEALKLCRFLAFGTPCSDDFRQEANDLRQEPVAPLVRGDSRPSPARRTDAPLLVLVAPGQETLIRAAIEAGAHSCLVLPIHFKEVISMLTHAREGNQPGRHTLNLEGAQRENPWRDNGGEG
jgi:CheY-like chemotaxis protein